MGILESITQAKAIYDAAEEIITTFNTSRSVLIQVYNETDCTMKIEGSKHAHGNWTEPPSSRIPPKTVDTFGSQSKAGSLMTGTEGWIAYKIPDADSSVSISWNNPWLGSNSGGAYAYDKTARFASLPWPLNIGRNFAALSRFFPSRTIQTNGRIGAGNDAKAKYEIYRK